MSHDSGIIV